MDVHAQAAAAIQEEVNRGLGMVGRGDGAAPNTRSAWCICFFAG